jgi:hypothetical protein
MEEPIMRDTSIGNLAEPMVAAALVAAIAWAATRIGPLALSRWLGL